ncbi:MAG: Internalin J [Mycoplasmataceae bacterium]|nr:MAG: Internalin J [Mycoplasmataceae bacterium]
MTDLKINQCPKIHEIFCNNNNLRYLPSLQKFKNLKKLHCYKNKNLNLVVCKGLKYLKELTAQECSLENVNFEDCENLRILDLAENKLTRINIRDCKNLQEFSCRDNYLWDIDLNNNHQLTDLFC